MDIQRRPITTAARRPSACRALWPAALLGAFALAAGTVTPAAGDGFHNAALATQSLDQWLGQVKQQVPRLGEEMEGSPELKSGRNLNDLQDRADEARGGSRSRPRPGGSIRSNLTEQERQAYGRMANDCMQIMAYMDPKNIYPNEFPNFNLNAIPQYRDAAKELLSLMGPEGAQPVVGAARNELMGMSGNFSDCTPSERYRDDLVDVLRAAAASGSLTQQQIDQLLEAAQGEKDPDRAKFAEEVRAALAINNASITELVELGENVQTPFAKRTISELIARRIATADVAELAEVVAEVDNSRISALAVNQLRKGIREAGVSELLQAQDKLAGESIAGDLARELARRSPKYSDVQGELGEIAKVARSKNQEVAAAARDQLENAFQRAPVAHCLWWMGRGDKDLAKLISEQLDGRIKRADAARRTSYAATALGVLKDGRYSTSSRTAALDLLGKVKHGQTVEKVNDMLLELPRELWGPSGKLLKDLSGKDYGPHDGDTIADVVEAKKKWDDWLRQ